MLETEYSQEALDSSRRFRIILDAMAKPGHVIELVTAAEAVPPLYATTLSIAQTLFDFQSPLWISPALTADPVARRLRFSTGVPLVGRKTDAAFALVSAAERMPALASFAQGTHEYPDRSTTLIIQVTEFAGQGVALSGPGIKQPVSFAAAGLTDDFWQQLSDNHQSYPLGVDVIFVSPAALACCPRSTRIHLTEPV
jgi:alpha-D-ribose 1-methylphosphonate 5-triphosphate synthase subunit PhnH